MNRNNRQGRMFQLAAKAIKYYLLGVFGFVVVCTLTATIGLFGWLQPMLPSLIDLILRVAALLLIFIAITIVTESLRY